MDFKFSNQVNMCVASHILKVSASAMKKEVKAFQEKALSEDILCRRVIAMLTQP